MGCSGSEDGVRRYIPDRKKVVFGYETILYTSSLQIWLHNQSTSAYLVIRVENLLDLQYCAAKPLL